MMGLCAFLAALHFVLLLTVSIAVWRMTLLSLRSILLKLLFRLSYPCNGFLPLLTTGDYLEVDVGQLDSSHNQCCPRFHQSNSRLRPKRLISLDSIHYGCGGCAPIMTHACSDPLVLNHNAVGYLILVPDLECSRHWHIVWTSCLVISFR